MAAASQAPITGYLPLPAPHGNLAVPQDPAQVDLNQLRKFVQSPEFDAGRISPEVAEQALRQLEASSGQQYPNVAPTVAPSPLQGNLLRQSFDDPAARQRGMTPRAADLLNLLGISPSAVDMNAVRAKLAQLVGLAPGQEGQITDEIAVTAFAAFAQAEGQLNLNRLSPAGQKYESLKALCLEQNPMLTHRIEAAYNQLYTQKNNSNSNSN